MTPDLAAHVESLAASWEALAVPHDARVVRGEAFVAALFPAQPVFDNALVLTADAVGRVESLYGGRPAALWSADDAVSATLEAAGFVRGESSVAMLLDALPDAADPEVVAVPLGLVAAVNGLDPAAVEGTPHAHGSADSDGLSVALVIDTGELANVSLVATDAAHRRQGRARRVLGAALADAGRRGMRGASLHAVEDAVGLYASLGFREVGRWQEWQRPVARS